MNLLSFNAFFHWGELSAAPLSRDVGDDAVDVMRCFRSFSQTNIFF